MDVTAHAAGGPATPFSRPGTSSGAWPNREQASTRWYSEYRRFWSGCEWSLFLPPAPGGFAEARRHKACAAGTAALQRRPAVYEFAITAGRSPKRFKVYVGETVSMWRRHHTEYQAHGDHLLPFLDAAVQSGCAVWRRQHYLASKQEAAAAELRWLSTYNYAWNARCNQRSRHVQLQPSWCGLRVAAVPVPPPWQPAAAAAKPPPRPHAQQAAQPPGRRPQQAQQQAVRPAQQPPTSLPSGPGPLAAAQHQGAAPAMAAGNPPPAWQHQHMPQVAAAQPYPSLAPLGQAYQQCQLAQPPQQQQQHAGAAPQHQQFHQWQTQQWQQGNAGQPQPAQHQDVLTPYGVTWQPLQASATPATEYSQPPQHM